MLTKIAYNNIYKVGQELGIKFRYATNYATSLTLNENKILNALYFDLPLEIKIFFATIATYSISNEFIFTFFNKFILIICSNKDIENKLEELFKHSHTHINNAWYKLDSKSYLYDLTNEIKEKINYFRNNYNVFIFLHYDTYKNCMDEIIYMTLMNQINQELRQENFGFINLTKNEYDQIIKKIMLEMKF